MDPQDLTFVESPEQLREILGPVSERVRTKVRDRLTDLDRAWIAASPFCLMGTSDESGQCDVSPKGGSGGLRSCIG